MLSPGLLLYQIGVKWHAASWESRDHIVDRTHVCYAMTTIQPHDITCGIALQLRLKMYQTARSDGQRTVGGRELWEINNQVEIMSFPWKWSMMSDLQMEQRCLWRGRMVAPQLGPRSPESALL